MDPGSDALLSEIVTQHPPPSDPREILYALSVFQATNLKRVMGTQHLGPPQFVEAFFKGVASIAFYRHRTETEQLLDTLFRQCDTDGDRKISFEDLHMTSVLIGRATVAGSRLREQDEVMVYNDLAAQILLPTVEGSSNDDGGGGGAPGSRRKKKSPVEGFGSEALAQLPEGMTLASMQQQLNINRYLAELNFSLCDGLTYLSSIDRHALFFRSDVVLFTFNDVCSALTDVRLLQGVHASPVIAIAHIPHLRKIITCGSDRAIAAWVNGADGYECHDETVRSTSPQTCVAYDPVNVLLVCGSTDGIISFFSMMPKLSHCIKTISAHPGAWINSIAYIAEVDAIASCCSQGALKIWDRGTMALRSGKTAPVSKVDAGASAVAHLQYSAALRCIFTSAERGREVLLWSPFLPQPTETLRGMDKPIIALKCFATSPELVTVEQSGKVIIRDMRKSMVVQSLGAPDSVCPVGRLHGASYDERRKAIVVLGERMNVFLPQRGSAQTSMLDSPISCVVTCSITRRLFLSSSGRLLVFDFMTGQLVFEHSLGTLDISTMALGSDVSNILIGTQEGTVLVLKIGTWHVVQRLECEDAVLLVLDLGMGSKLGSRAPDLNRAVAVAANGDVWHFPHGPLCSGYNHTSVLIRTRSAPTCVAMAPQQSYVYLASRQVVVVWDIAVQFVKPSLAIDIPAVYGPVTAIQHFRPIDSLLVGTFNGYIIAYAASTTVQIFATRVMPDGRFVPRAFAFSNFTWRLGISASDGVASLDLTAVNRAVEAHNAVAVARFTASKLVAQRKYEVDLSNVSAAELWSPTLLPCIKRSVKDISNDASGPSTATSTSAAAALMPQHLRSLFVIAPLRRNGTANVMTNASFTSNTDGLSSESDPNVTAPAADATTTTRSAPASATHLLRRFQHFADAQKQFSFGKAGHTWKYTARLFDVYIPTAADRLTDARGQPVVYAVFSRVTRPSLEGGAAKVGWVNHFDQAADAIENDDHGPSKVATLNDLRWLLYCAAASLDEMHRMGAVPLLNMDRDMAMDAEQFRLVPSQGTWPTSSVSIRDGEEWDVAPPPNTLLPPEGWSRVPTAACNAWLMGLFLHRVACGEPATRNTVSMGDGPAGITTPRELESTVDPTLCHRPVYTTAELQAKCRPTYSEKWIVELMSRLLCLETTRWSAYDVQQYLEAPAPRHRACRKLAAPPLHRASYLDVDPHDLHGALTTSSLPPMNNAFISSFTVSDRPFVYLSGVFNHRSAHVLVMRTDGGMLGVLPASNELRVAWAVDAEDVLSDVAASNAERFAALGETRGGGNAPNRPLQLAPLALNDGGNKLLPPAAVRRPRTLDSDMMSRHCPFFTSVQDGREAAGLPFNYIPIGEPPYYMQGWHRLRGTTVEWMRKGESRQLAQLEAKVHTRHEAVEAVRKVRIAEQQEAERRKQAIADARARVQATPVIGVDETPEAQQPDDLSLLASNTNYDRIRDRKEELQKMMQDMSIAAMDAPIRGRELPPDPVLAPRRAATPSIANRNVSRQPMRLGGGSSPAPLQAQPQRTTPNPLAARSPAAFVSKPVLPSVARKKAS